MLLSSLLPLLLLLLLLLLLVLLLLLLLSLLSLPLLSLSLPVRAPLLPLASLLLDAGEESIAARRGMLAATRLPCCGSSSSLVSPPSRSSDACSAGAHCAMLPAWVGVLPSSSGLVNVRRTPSGRRQEEALEPTEEGRS
ncbi:MAG: hypothetical protein ACK4ZJ_16615, partial [Allorhizobium sp.]